MKFNITVDKKLQAAVDAKRCINCGECTELCPTGAMNEYRKAVSCGSGLHGSNGVQGKTCTYGCPLGISPQSAAALVKNGDYETAIGMIYAKNPLPKSTAQICRGYCRERCIREAFADEAVNMPALERHILGKADEYGHKNGGCGLYGRNTRKYREKIAVIGGGPAGLAAAYRLTKLGYGVTVFEKDSALGGAMSWGIPGSRLDKAILRREINDITAAGIEVRCGVAVGRDISVEEMRGEGFEAFLIAVGASYGIKARVENLAGESAYDAVSVLRYLNGAEPKTGDKIQIGEKTVIFGSEEIAADAGRILAEQGKEVICVTANGEGQLLISDEERRRLENEGVEFILSAVPKQIIREDGRIKAVELIRTEFVKTHDGRRRLHALKGSETNVFCDTVISAMGRRCDVSNIINAETYPDGKIKTNGFHMTNKEMVFACGEAAGESRSVAEALRAGLEAAEDMDNALRQRMPERRHKNVFEAEAAECIGIQDIPMIYPQRESLIAADDADGAEMSGGYVQSGQLRPAEFEDILTVLRSAGIEADMPVICESRKNKNIFAQDRGQTEETAVDIQQPVRVAVIGGGIAGITAAISLAKKGYVPTIFEKTSALGGIYTWYATEYRIDKNLLAEELKKVEAAGIEVVYNTGGGIKPDFKELFDNGFAAVLTALGESVPKKGAEHELRGVFDMTELIGRLAREEMTDGVGGNAMVFGSDERAVDTALKLREHCESVTLLTDRSRGGLRPLMQAVDAAVTGGINIITGVVFCEAEQEDGQLTGIKYKISENGRILSVPCDMAVLDNALRQDTDGISIANLELDIDADGSIAADDNLATSVEGVFAIGPFDMSAPDAGRAGAAAVDGFLSGKKIPVIVQKKKAAHIGEAAASYETIEAKAPENPGKNCGNLLLDDRKAVFEASRCVMCGYCKADAEKCIGCGICARFCPENAVEMIPTGNKQPAYADDSIYDMLRYVLF